MQPRQRRIEAALVVALLLLGLGVRLRMARDWVYAGSDSYGYLQVADELRRAGRYALGPSPEPGYWARPPLYPLFLATVEGEAPPRWFHLGAAQPNWYRIKYAQIALDVLGLGPLVYFLARRMGGRHAAKIALTVAMICPFTVVYCCSAMTEVPAMVLTMAVTALLVAGPGHERARLFGAGFLAGLATLVRFDSILLLPSFAVALLLSTRPWRPAPALLAACGFLVAFSPWPLRNWVQFHDPHLMTTYLDRFSRPAEQVAGYHRWVATWAHDDSALRDHVWCFHDPTCTPKLERYPAAAFSGDDERQLAALLFARRAREGIGADLSSGFDELARLRRARSPLQVGLLLPLERSVRLWINRHDDLLLNPAWRPWRAITNWIYPAFLPLAWVLFLSWLAAGAALVRVRQTRAAALILLSVLLVRTLVLAWGYFPEGRYVVEVMPLSYALVAVGGVLGWRKLAARWV